VDGADQVGAAAVGVENRRHRYRAGLQTGKIRRGFFPPHGGFLPDRFFQAETDRSVGRFRHHVLQQLVQDLILRQTRSAIIGRIDERETVTSDTVDVQPVDHIVHAGVNDGRHEVVAISLCRCHDNVAITAFMLFWHRISVKSIVFANQKRVIR
jgi:hypothetical protein